MRYRWQRVSLRQEMLARALGLKRGEPLKIVDATAGLGQDAFVVAALGFELHLLERSPAVFALLQDAILRAAQDPAAAAVADRMRLIHTDAVVWLQQNAAPDVIYLDPMFPSRNKSALSKKAMRTFHELVGHDEDAGILLNTALACAVRRVVVKRPRLAAALADQPPNYSLFGKSSRFDIYLTTT